jgi:hypothetical protein
MYSFSRYLLRPWFLAGLLTLIFFLVLPAGKRKYNVTVNQGKFAEALYHEYYDLDGDGRPEKINTISTGKPSAITVLSAGRKMIDQWNFEGEFHTTNDYLAYSDITEDKKKEVFAFYHRNDSLFLLGINAFYQPRLLFKDLFIDRLEPRYGESAYYIPKTRWFDYDDDGILDLYFILSGGHSVNPRNLYRINMQTFQLSKSDLSPVQLLDFQFHDLDSDGIPEILLSTIASANVDSDTLLYSDRYTWLLVLDQDIGLFLNPKRLSPLFSAHEVIPLKGTENFLSVITENTDSVFQSALRIYNGSGEVTDSTRVSYPLLYHTISGNKDFTRENILMSSSSAGKFFSLNEQLGVKELASYGKETLFLGDFFFDPDSLPEYLLFFPESSEAMITRSDFKEMVTFKLPFSMTGSRTWVQTVARDKSFLKFAVNTSKEFYDITLSRNLWFYYRFILYAVFFVIFYYFFRWIRSGWEAQLREKTASENRMLQLQLTSLSSQLDPHLTFNILNTIAYSVLKHEGKEMHELFTRFTGYIHKALLSSDKLIVPITHEIEFVDAYLRLEKARMKDKLMWSITLDPELPAGFFIPRMAIQNLVENAVKHGLSPKKEGGFIDISVRKTEHAVLINVKDNGVGKSDVNSLRTRGTGKGMSILQQFFNLLNTHNKEKACLRLEFPTDEEGNPLGADAEITIPHNYSFY